MAFPARYAGTCSGCNRSINKGDLISWSRRHKGKVYHATCAGQDEAMPARSSQAQEQADEQTFGEVPSPTPAPEPKSQPDASQEPQEPQGEGEQGKQDESLEAIITRVVQKRLKLDRNQIAKIAREAVGTDPDAIDKAISEAFARREPVTVNVERKDETVTIDGAHCKFPLLLKLVSQGLHCYLYGAPGGGKSYAAKQAAETLARPFGYISLNPQTPDSRLMGYMDATGVYRATPFYECYVAGGVFCIDELDNASAALLTTINGALENGHCAFPNGVQKRHGDFVLVGTGNTSGKGAHPAFPERRPFDAAFADRFVYVEWTYDEALERKVATANFNGAGQWIEWAIKVRSWAAKNDPRLVVSPRVSIRGAILLSMGFAPADVADMVLFRGTDADRRNKVLANNPLPVVS